MLSGKVRMSRRHSSAASSDGATMCRKTNFRCAQVTPLDQPVPMVLVPLLFKSKVALVPAAKNDLLPEQVDLRWSPVVDHVVPRRQHVSAVIRDGSWLP